MFEGIVKLSKSIFPFKNLEVVEVEIRGYIDEFGDNHLAGNIEFPLLNENQHIENVFAPLSTQVTENISEIHCQIQENDLLDPIILLNLIVLTIEPIQSVEIINLGIDYFSILKKPEIIDLTSLLKFTKTGVEGKKYGFKDNVIDQKDSIRQLELSTNLPQTCKHGITLKYCDICSKSNLEHKSNKDIKSQKINKNTISVFDLLLPYLQPPLTPLLNNPVLFPPGLRPRDYQITGIKFLAERKSALLGDEMGLGKTIQVIMALQLLFRQGKLKNVLILCPRSLLGNWEHELQKWAPELYVTKVRADYESRKILWSSPSRIYLTTYETLREDIQRDTQLKTKFDLVVLDEAQKIKSDTSKTSQSVKRLNSQYRWAITGTPLENDITDVISIFDFLQPNLFTSDSFLYSTDVIKRKIEPYFLRRRTKDVLKELNEKVVNEVWLDLLTKQREHYNLTEKRAKEQISTGNVTRIHIFALINELKQICNMHPTNDESCKVDYLLDQLDNVIGQNQKALVFSHFPKVTLGRVKQKLLKFQPEIFDGSLNDNQRKIILESFTLKDNPKVLLMSIQSGGVGLNLIRANHVFHFDHWWNPAVARQAEGRAHRMGQEQTVFVYDIYTNNTIEERIYNLLRKKQHLFDIVIDDLSAEYIQSKVTDDELFGLFDLKPPPGIRKDESKISSNLKTSSFENDLAKLSPIQFEKLIEDLYKKMGYVTIRTPASHDGGVDIIAVRNTHLVREKIIIQCKHYSNTVGVEPIRALIGTWHKPQFSDADYALLITSGFFSETAIREASQQRIRLIDRINLKQLITDNNIQF